MGVSVSVGEEGCEETCSRGIDRLQTHISQDELLSVRSLVHFLFPVSFNLHFFLFPFSSQVDIAFKFAPTPGPSFLPMLNLN